MRYFLLFILLYACKDPLYKEAYNYTDCGVSVESPYLSDDLVFLPEETLNIAIRIIHVTRDTFALQGRTIVRAIDSLNASFASANIKFNLIDYTAYNPPTDTIDIINHRQDILAYKKANRNEDPAIDIFVYRPNFNYYPGVALAIKSDALAVQIPFFNSNTLIHEVGHCLGLHHTHDNSGNGYETGDFICDTPETGIINGYIDANCKPKGKITNLDEKEVEIIIRNYMSYVNKACRREFTKDQIDKMRFHISRESLLRNTLIF
jgi:hypothetical protein